jgi:hypothetical protein
MFGKKQSDQNTPKRVEPKIAVSAPSAAPEPSAQKEPSKPERADPPLQQKPNELVAQRPEETKGFSSPKATLKPKKSPEISDAPAAKSEDPFADEAKAPKKEGAPAGSSDNVTVLRLQRARNRIWLGLCATGLI